MKALPLLFLLATGAATAGDWPHWRGPERNGMSAETAWTSNWPSTGPKVAWQAEVGIGFASFAVAEGRAYTTGNTDNTDTLYCFDAATGKAIWHHAYPADLGDKYFEGGTTGTPTVEDGKVYQLSRWGDVFCLDAATGKVIWKKNVQEETQARLPDWGFSGSPLVWKNLLILNVGQSGLALEKSTGKIVWKSDEKAAGYSTPLPYLKGEETLVALASGKAYMGIKPQTGEVVWEFPWNTSYGVNASDPIITGEKVFISSGYNKGAALLDTSVNPPTVVWQSRNMRNQMNPPVLIDGHLYGVDGNEGKDASLKCMVLATGEVKWSETSVGAGSVMAANGKLIVLSETGELIIAKATPDAFQPLARASVLTGRCWTVPVLSDGRIYCRNAEGRVVCLDVSAK